MQLLILPLMDFSFDKAERLCSKKALDELFASGKSKSQFPLKLIYKSAVFESPYPARVVFIVPKKKHRRANKRNTIRRRLREAYRLYKHEMYVALGEQKLDLMFVFLSTDVPDYHQLEPVVRSLMNHAAKSVQSTQPKE